MCNFDQFEILHFFPSYSVPPQCSVEMSSLLFSNKPFSFLRRAQPPLQSCVFLAPYGVWLIWYKVLLARSHLGVWQNRFGHGRTAYDFYLWWEGGGFVFDLKPYANCVQSCIQTRPASLSSQLFVYCTTLRFEVTLGLVKVGYVMMGPWSQPNITPLNPLDAVWTFLSANKYFFWKIV